MKLGHALSLSISSSGSRVISVHSPLKPLGHQYTRSLHFLGAEGTFQSSAMVPWKYLLELRLEDHTHLHLFSAGGRYRQHSCSILWKFTSMTLVYMLNLIEGPENHVTVF